MRYVPDDVHQLLAVAGIPDEYVIPLPVILEVKPSLVGYYRLLLGSPKKQFYGAGTGMNRFEVMEDGRLTAGTRLLLPDFCIAMSHALADMVRQLSPAITKRDLIELPVMTLGQRFQGANNNQIGQEAIGGVFRAIKEIVHPYIQHETETAVIIQNPGGKTLDIVLGADPDVGIRETSDGSPINKLALEIKGGTDRSNQHNRIGEAEKSHLKARADGYQDCWTVIRTATLDASARQQSPSTRLWFDTAQVLARSGADWDQFVHEIAHVVAVPNPFAASPQPIIPARNP